MLGRRRVHSAAAVGLLLGACAQIIGVDSLEDEDVEDPQIIRAGGGSTSDGGEGGEGEGAEGGEGKGGNAGDGGETSSTDAGAGGAAGAGGEGMAGDAGSGGAAGAGGALPSCGSVTEITASFFSIDPTSDASGHHYYMLSSSLGSSALPDFLNLEFYAPLGASEGHTVALEGPPENDYATCSHCVFLETDYDSSDNTVSGVFFAASGSMTIAAGSQQLGGAPDLTLSDVLLVEAEIAPNTFETTFVPNGQCLHLNGATLDVSGRSWSCDAAYFGDGLLCDCGCDVGDVDCQNGSEAACEVCNCDPDACFVGDPTQCVPLGSWTCNPAYQGDGECDCGCGSVDPDCPSALASDCEYKLCPSGNVVADNNAICDDWTCNPSWYGDGDCDCGCGIVDVDCASSSDTCEFCWCSSGNCTVPNNLCDWTCSRGYYGDGFCDCGCGALDSDCQDLDAASCEACWCPGDHSTCDGSVVSNDNTACN